MTVTEEQVRDALKEVIDPELFVNIVDLGLIYEVAVVPGEGGESEAGEAQDAVFITMTLTSPACPSGPQMVEQSKATVRRLDGVGNVELKMVLSPPWKPEMMTEDAKDQLGIFD